MKTLGLERSPDKCPLCNTLMTGRHCFATGCGFTFVVTNPKLHRKPEPNSGSLLLAVVAKHGLLLGANAIEWRAVGDEDGVPGAIASLNLECRLVATDGIAAWAILADGTPFYCHLAAFAQQRAATNEGTPKARKGSRRQELLDSI